MDFKQLIENFKNIVTNKYFCFDGRTGKKSFWQYVLVLFVGSVILSLIPGVGQILSGLWSLALLLPTLGITARRLHDTGKSALLLLLHLIPMIGSLIVLILCIPDGEAQANQYGEADEK